MLVIARKEGQSFLIGDDIEVTVIKQLDGTVKLGINAPKDKVILRKELIDEVKNENKMAQTQTTDLSALKAFNGLKKHKNS
ncbi:carbon storage regulator [Clostridium sp. HCP1S3_B4]|uniref:carbon storage regulator n=1 Tax=unclassified Clostridium TaxID=2614128 RepID=UPI002A7A01AB|nr:carbon storage regulator [Clostridiales bacterium]MDY2729504.1 carbon storage regulator [Clostridium sp.]